jgi:Zn-dependent protease
MESNGDRREPAPLAKADEFFMDVDAPRPGTEIDISSEPVAAELVGEDAGSSDDPPERTLNEDDLRSGPRRRRVRLPVVLFAATCLSCFWVGIHQWLPPPTPSAEAEIGLRRLFLRNGVDGLIYTAAVLGILLSHEMGHFLATVRYRIPASLPIFLPLPIQPIGTLGAVIAMEGSQADRKQLFDIGLAGPLAGLIVALPITILGVQQIDFNQQANGVMAFDTPLLIRFLFQFYDVPGYQPGQMVTTGHLNPFYMAGWVGLLITGLNMMPISQLDGGHVIYALFGKRAHWVARGFMFFAIVFVVFLGGIMWILMLVLVILLGADHPPTRNDNVPLGAFRTGLGYASLVIPFLCFPPGGLKVMGM